jgi:hypothetical protein
VTEDIDPLDELQRMAFECRSVIYNTLGMWYLKVLPDSAPATTKTIELADLAGQGAEFRCGYTSRDDIVNSIVLNYSPNWGPTKDSDPWRRTIEVDNIVGSYPTLKGDSLDLRMVYGDAQAADVAEIYLLQRNKVMRTVEFDVFWQHTDLRLGDTIELGGTTFWGGVKFWVTGVARQGINKATISAVEWHS